MEPIYVQNFTMDDVFVDCFDKMKPSMILYLAQVMGGRHSELLHVDYDTLASRQLFWAVTRHRVQVTRLPLRGETIRVERASWDAVIIKTQKRGFYQILRNKLIQNGGGRD